VGGQFHPTAAPVFDVPSDRRITWSAGLDPVGGIPNYTDVICPISNNSGTEDVTAEIQHCIDIAKSNTAVFIPAGKYLIGGTINMRSNVALRGAKASVGPWLPLKIWPHLVKGFIVFNGGTEPKLAGGRCGT
jgi:hypothetical protein